MFIIQFIIQLGSAFVLDLLFGDPEYPYHPIRLIGGLIARLEKPFRRISGRQMLNGALFALFIILFSYFAVVLLLSGAAWIDRRIPWAPVPVFRSLVSIYILYSCISLKDLKDKAMEIKHALDREGVESARQKLSMIVGRDTAHLDEKETVRATVETAAENIVDGILSPLFFAFIGGAPMMLAYKAANTLDSMVGYKNEKYIYFGRVSARIDDVLNFIPARLSALFIPLASLITGKNGFRAFKTTLKDGQKHTSPNAGIPEAAIAGALGVQLGGVNYYFGEKSVKPHIGQPIHALNRDHITQTIVIAYGASVLFLLAGLFFLPQTGTDFVHRFSQTFLL